VFVRREKILHAWQHLLSRMMSDFVGQVSLHLFFIHRFVGAEGNIGCTRPWMRSSA